MRVTASEKKHCDAAGWDNPGGAIFDKVSRIRGLIWFAHASYNRMFCPECNSLMISSAGQLKCRKCGYIRKIRVDDQMTRTTRGNEKQIVIVEEDAPFTLPTIAIKCPKCENNLAFWWLRQLRAADESEVRFFRCTTCSHTWRQYD
jgi:DNA-directed RNA polymerase subunit M